MLERTLDNVEYPYCYVLKFKDEPKGMCCGNGEIKLPPLDNLIEPLLSYLSGFSNENTFWIISGNIIQILI